jgi:hypothetical protein
MHEALIARLAARGSVTVKDCGNHWAASASVPAGWRFEFVIPKDVAEWFVDAWPPDAKQKVWSSWSDWSATKEEPSREEMMTRYASDVEHFLERIEGAEALRCTTKYTFRLLSFRMLPQTVLERLCRGKWEEVDVGVLP